MSSTIGFSLSPPQLFNPFRCLTFLLNHVAFPIPKEAVYKQQGALMKTCGSHPPMTIRLFVTELSPPQLPQFEVHSHLRLLGNSWPPVAHGHHIRCCTLISHFIIVISDEFPGILPCDACLQPTNLRREFHCGRLCQFYMQLSPEEYTC